MDPTRSGAVLARHTGIDEAAGQLAADGDEPRQLIISNDFYSSKPRAHARHHAHHNVGVH